MPPRMGRAPNELEIQTEESTMGRFDSLFGRLLDVPRSEMRAAEEVYKKERRKKRAAKRKAEKVAKKVEGAT